MKRVFRPFWSYNILGTEEWLAELAEQGWQLVKFNRFTRVFYFQKSEPKTYSYQIGFERMKDYQLPNALSADGWQKQYQNSNWYVMRNEKPREDIKVTSARENIILKNRVHYFIYCGYLIYCVHQILLNFLDLSLLVFLPTFLTGTILGSPLRIISYIIAAFTIFAFMVSISSFNKIRKSNKQLVKCHFNSPAFEMGEELSEYLPFEFEEEQKLRKAGLLLKKRNFTWMNQPDKLEDWLEKMEAKGFNLLHVNRGTTFYFLKGDKRKLSYCVLFQNVPDETAYFFHKDNGWKHIFSARSLWQIYSIWAKEYDEEEKPQIYSEKEIHLKAAWKIPFPYLIIDVPLIALFTFFIIKKINWNLNSTGILKLLNDFYLILFTLCFLILSTSTFQCLRYYYRVKKKYEY
ncbi:DUF2812 domain-containing protein [Ferdinandcohnia quinoae]|uniref:DUF2812 domain-containing protein n=1 Tax=Fredinandcohnia quinoae TaxID=2918902 RepID=A0AAW5E6X3_9BACI|nr:DUF2812 domain-containing protein [Fredinandcohnia sp. SECRCQ15]MCH1625746.1 DUF2812 domain-containing protein [Fredinandcohnia sp. SECRCQ15]